ncbi:MAG: hypothetical protein NTW94_08340 [Legionellales bacterium]|nr:hypothetical protein [Legionellales bacterium]
MAETDQQKRDRLRRELEEASHHSKRRRAKPIEAPGAHGFLASTEETAPSLSMVPAPKSKKKDWDEIVAAYREAYRKEPDEHGALVFPSREAAIAFFQVQAKALRQFLATAYKNEVPSDFHVFSCGDGVLYSGSHEQITSKLTEDKNTKGLKLFHGMMPNAPKPVDEKHAHEDKAHHKRDSKTR